MSDQPSAPQEPTPNPSSQPPATNQNPPQQPSPTPVPQQPPGGPPQPAPAQPTPAHPNQASAPQPNAAQPTTPPAAQPAQPVQAPMPQQQVQSPTPQQPQTTVQPQPAGSPPAAATTATAIAPKPKKKKPEEIHEVTFVAYPKMLFVWPVMLAGVLFWFLDHWGVPPEPLGWCYITIVGLTFLVLGIDLGRNVAVFWLAVILVFLFAGLWLQQYKHFTLFGDLFRLLANLDVKYDRGTGIAISMVLLVPYSIMLVWARINDRWRITHNEFEHYSFGKMDDSLGRGAKTIRTSYPDILELIMGFAGTLIVYNATGTRELRRIPHVMFLPWVRKKLNKILEKTAVTAAQLEEEEDDDEDYMGA